MILTVLLTFLSAIVGVGLVLWLIGERGRFLRPSTTRFFREGGRLHGYIYGRWTRQYIHVLLNTLRPTPKAGTWLSDRYHGKVLTHENAKSIITLNRPIPLRDLDQIVPYPVARNLVLEGPPDVAVYECVCRHARAQSCQPSRVCMVIGQPFVDFVVEHHPETSHRLTQAEALELLQAEHERGHVHSAWFKDAMLNRFYAICNCCKCCCGGIRAMTEWGVPMVTSSGYVAMLDEARCNQCGDCVDACPFSAMAMNDGQVERSWERCLGCGVCEVKCSAGAIALARDERKGIPLDVRALA